MFDVFDNATGNRDRRGEFFKAYTDGHQEDGADRKGDHRGDQACAHHHPVFGEQYSARVDDRSKTDREEIKEGELFLYRATRLGTPFNETPYLCENSFVYCIVVPFV